MKSRLNFQEKGLTLVESITVLAIILIFMIVVTLNYRGAGLSFALLNNAHILVQNLRVMEEKATSAQDASGTTGSYGIYIASINSVSYILFDDKNGNMGYDAAGGEKIEEVNFSKRISLKSVTPALPLVIIFSPPDPSVYITGSADETTIVLQAQEIAAVKTIKVNKSGLVSIK